MYKPMGPSPQRVICPQCKKPVETQIEMRASTRTHILAMMLLVFGCFPCAASLYCTNFSRDTEHFCPECKTYLGVYER